MSNAAYREEPEGRILSFPRSHETQKRPFIADFSSFHLKIRRRHRLCMSTKSSESICIRI